jgi:hypothetical protein
MSNAATILSLFIGFFFGFATACLVMAAKDREDLR